MRKRIVITGAGVVSAIGIGKYATLKALRNGCSGISRVHYLHTTHSEFPVGEVKMSNEEMRDLLQIPTHKIFSRTELLGIIALKEALEEAHLAETLALISGTTVGGMDLTESHYPDHLTRDILDIHDCGACTDGIADYFGCFDACTTCSTACSSALNAIILGTRLIESGCRDVVAVGGSECLSKFHLNGFKSLMILDEQSCKPFDARRNGINLGEGAGYLILESEEHAHIRGAQVMAELRGVGNSCDAFHQTSSSPEGEGAYQAMREALQTACLDSSNIQYLNAHGTGTINNDASESVALRRVFGEQMPLVSSTKGMTGHTTSASGSIESVFCLLALQHQFVPVNFGFLQPDETCIKPVQESKQVPLTNVQCNAFGFGGNDSSIIFSIAKQEGGNKLIGQQEAKDCLSSIEIGKQKGNRSVYIISKTENMPEKEYGNYLQPLKARRYGKLLKRALVTALACIKDSGIEKPDAIINGTALGCIESSEKILDALADEGESVSMPTHFMQSTHNTIASLIGIYTHNHAYNNTYSHRRISFESALMDAFLQIRQGDIHSALVCANDELTVELQKKLDQVGLNNGIACDRSVAIMLSDIPGNSPLGILQDIKLIHHPNGDDRAEIHILPINNKNDILKI
jgi:3-oxoacyl-[acyl-carrier-protein] synthase II